MCDYFPTTLASISLISRSYLRTSRSYLPHISPHQVCDYFPTTLASLRTCKSGVCVGVEPEVEAAAAAAHPDKWLVGGIYGMVQLKQEGARLE